MVNCVLASNIDPTNVILWLEDQSDWYLEGKWSCNQHCKAEKLKTQWTLISPFELKYSQTFDPASNWKCDSHHPNSALLTTFQNKYFYQSKNLWEIIRSMVDVFCACVCVWVNITLQLEKVCKWCKDCGPRHGMFFNFSNCHKQLPRHLSHEVFFPSLQFVSKSGQRWC